MKRTAAVAAVAAALWLAGGGAAEAQVRTEGAADAVMLIGRDVLGGALSVDVWAALADRGTAARLRIGGAIGGGGISSDDDTRSRALMPLGASISLLVSPSQSWFLEARARGGMWAGATNQGLGAGAWLAGGAYFGYALGPNASLGAGVSAWWLGGYGSLFVVAPGITANWFPWES